MGDDMQVRIVFQKGRGAIGRAVIDNDGIFYIEEYIFNYGSQRLFIIVGRYNNYNTKLPGFLMP